MEKRFFLALALSMTVMVLWWQIFPPPKPTPKPPAEDTAKTSAAPAVGEEPAKTTVAGEAQTPGAGETAPDLQVEPQIEAADEAVLQNDLLRIVATPKGAALTSAELLDYFASTEARRAGESPLQLLMPSDHGLNALRLEDFSRGKADLGLRVWREVARDVPRSVTYETRYKDTLSERASEIVLKKTFRLPEGRARYLEVEFSWRVEGEALDREFGLLLTGGVFQDPTTDVFASPKAAVYPFEGDLSLREAKEILAAESKLREERGPAGIGMLGTIRGLRSRLTGADSVLLSGPTRYAGDASNYFGAFLLLEDFPGAIEARVNSIGRSDKGSILEEQFEQGTQTLRTTTLLVVNDRVEAGQEKVWKGKFYLGPFDAKILEEALAGKVTDEKIEALSLVHDEKLGFARSIARLILGALRALYSLVQNWGLAIILLTVCVRLLLFPLNKKSQSAMLRMQEAHAKIKPKLDKLKEKYKDDPKRMAAEQMTLFRQEKVPMVPLGGCLPMFLQMPIFFGLFSALRASVDLRQASFWWVDDLAQPDRLIAFSGPVMNPMSICSCVFPVPPEIDGLHLLPILMTLAWFASSALAPKPAEITPEMAQQRKMMMFMPVLFGLMMYTYAAGLSLYWLTSSLIGIAESKIIRRLIKKPAAR